MFLLFADLSWITYEDSNTEFSYNSQIINKHLRLIRESEIPQAIISYGVKKI